MSNPSSSSNGARYSRAFDNLVETPDDTVGLLAYTLFKQAIREDAVKGVHIGGGVRDPSTTTVQVYRASADMRLRDFAANAVDAAREDILNENTISAIRQAASEINQNIDRNTGIRAAVTANIIAWIFTILLTYAVATQIYMPNWQAGMVDQIKRGHDQPSPKPPG